MGTEFINDSVSPHTKENCRTFRTAVLEKRRFLKRQILSSSLKDCDAPRAGRILVTLTDDAALFFDVVGNRVDVGASVLYVTFPVEIGSRKPPPLTSATSA